MKRLLTAILISTILFFITGCSHQNTDEEYYYKETTVLNGIYVEFYGKGYGNYGQLLPNYYTGSIESIFDSASGITITTGTTDNNLATANEIYLTLTYPELTYVNELVTLFTTGEKKQISGFKISYKTDEENETTIAGSFKEEKTYSIKKSVRSITLYVKQNKYYSSSYEIEELRDRICHNPFTIVQFLPN